MITPEQADQIAAALKQARRVKRDLKRSWTLADSMLPDVTVTNAQNAVSAAPEPEDPPTPQQVKTAVLNHIMNRPSVLFKVAELQESVKLQPHQKRVLKRLKKQDSLLLYHGLGSGKTLSSIAATEGHSRDVIVPAALRNNYRQEVSSKTDSKTPTNVMSYERGTKPYKPSDTLVIDEAHRLGSVSTQRSQQIVEKAKKYKKRILLTGSPLRNAPAELAPLAHILDPNTTIPLDPGQFNKRFLKDVEVKPGFIDKWFRGVEPGIEQRAQNLGDLRKAFAGKVDYYAPKQENYPEKHEHTVDVEMSPEQRAIYETITEKANPKIARKIRENFPLSKQESANLNAFMTSARIASNSVKPFGGHGYTPKMQRMLQDFQESAAKNPDHKALVYSQFLDGGVSEFSKLLTENKIPHGLFRGGLSDKERQQVLDDYNTGKTKALLLTGAGAEGISTRGTRAVQLMESSWNAPRRQQVEGRGIRFGSHADLPEDQRNVDVLRYRSTMAPSLWQKITRQEPDTAADEYLDEIAKKKERLNAQFLHVLQEEGRRSPQA